MTLADAMGHLRSISDQTHKFWGYYQVVTAAAIGFAWTSNKPPCEMIVGLVVAFAIFASLNCWLVVSSQATALAVWTAIQSYEPLPGEQINPGLLPITRLNRPENPTLIGAMHVALSLVACVAIYARNLSAP